MDNKEKWNKIVEIFNRNKSSQEQFVQLSWESIFSELFGYSKLDGDIDSQRPVKMGVSTKYPDIIIRNKDEDLFVVELKRSVLHEGQEQLFSYLNQLKIDLGILVCNKLYIYDYDFLSKDNNYLFMEIDFIEDNPLGMQFLELFSKNDFDKEIIKTFISEYSEKKDSIKMIQEKLTSEFIKNLVKEYFEKEYDSETVNAAFSNYQFSFSKKNDYENSINVTDSYQNSTIINNTSAAPEVVLMIGDRNVTSKEFKDRLLITKVATRFWYYNNKTEPDVDIWNAYSFRPDSNLMGNIHSTKYRHWKTSGLTKIICVIKE